MTTDAFGSALSSVVKLRPRIGLTPITEKNSAVTFCAINSSGFPPSVRLARVSAYAAMLSNEVARSFQRMKFEGPTTFGTSGRCALISQMTAIRSASRYGKRSRNTALTTVKIALFTPIPSASVRTATNVKPGDFSSWRKAKRRSIMGIFEFRFSIFDFLVPKLCLGMRMSGQLCCHVGETKFRRQVRSQTEFGNEELAVKGRTDSSGHLSLVTHHFFSFGVESDNGIDGAGPARGQPAGNERDEHERRREEEKRDGIARADSVEERRDQSR